MSLRRLPCLESYFAAWNARDARAIRYHLARAFGQNTRYLDPHRAATGMEEFAACLIEFRAGAPEAEVTWASEVDSHHNLHRYAWRLRDGLKSLVGYDVVEVGSDMRIVSVLSFFGPLKEVTP